MADPTVEIILESYCPGYFEVTVTLDEKLSKDKNCILILRATTADKRAYPAFPLIRKRVQGRSTHVFTDTFAFPPGQYRFSAAVTRSDGDLLLVYSDVMDVPDKENSHHHKG
ncbi:hypothetical protein Daesc_009483 [Daldinia eschscholtzii]|uniref:Uncharacterized protein n=1 Tax=Daldinia eschscholtzii TaxID=292717 RepID=A0AAX6MAJ8_9PEZI